jgi:hypothetical protein
MDKSIIAIVTILPGVEEVLATVAPFGKLIINLQRPRPFGLKALPLDVAVNSIELSNEGIKLLLLLPEASFMGKDPRLVLTLVLLFLVGSIFVSLAIFVVWWCRHEASSSHRLSGDRVGSSVELCLESSSRRSKTDFGWWPMMATNVEGEAPFAFCLTGRRAG